MGSFGSITIYDWTKTVKQFPELLSDEKLYRQVVGDAYIYDNPWIEGNQLLVSYYGDNLLYKDTFPGFDYWAVDPDNVPEDIKKAYKIVRWIHENARIVWWEVWT
ncbi:hypothetical protein [Paraclostridium dentum]|uniref:hypothetical protein n=1 Tax=Paraclostridium dentum TaxID=2662455 RepID=UPI00346389A9